MTYLVFLLITVAGALKVGQDTKAIQAVPVDCWCAFYYFPVDPNVPDSPALSCDGVTFAQYEPQHFVSACPDLTGALSGQDPDGGYYGANCFDEYPDCENLGLSATAAGDPHVTNMKGQKFDVFTAGTYSFVRYPQSAKTPMLSIDAVIHDYASGCSSTFIKELVIQGTWLKEPIMVGITPPGSSEALQMRSGRDEEWAAIQASRINESVFDSKAISQKEAAHLRLQLEGVEISVRASSTASPPFGSKMRKKHYNFLDLDVRGLQKLSEKVGGILGMDTYEEQSQDKAKRCQGRESNKSQYISAAKGKAVEIMDVPLGHASAA